MGAALPIVGGLALGGLGAGMSAMQANSQRRQQQAIQQQAQQQQMMQSMMAQQQAQQQQQQMEQQMQFDAEQSKKRAEQLKANVGPKVDSTPKGLSTIATSPLGDISQPTIGRRSLLAGNNKPGG